MRDIRLMGTSRRSLLNRASRPLLGQERAHTRIVPAIHGDGQLSVCSPLTRHSLRPLCLTASLGWGWVGVVLDTKTDWQMVTEFA
jgi:hypothetical protein